MTLLSTIATSSSSPGPFRLPLIEFRISSTGITLFEEHSVLILSRCWTAMTSTATMKLDAFSSSGRLSKLISSRFSPGLSKRVMSIGRSLPCCSFFLISNICPFKMRNIPPGQKVSARTHSCSSVDFDRAHRKRYNFDPSATSLLRALPGVAGFSVGKVALSSGESQNGKLW